MFGIFPPLVLFYMEWVGCIPTHCISLLKYNVKLFVMYK